MNKITLPEIIMLVLIALSFDIVGIIFGGLVLIPIIGVVFGVVVFVMDVVAFVILQGWLIIRGGVSYKQTASILGNLLDTIPIVNILPLKTLGVIITIIMINKAEEIEKIAGPAMKIAKKTI